MKVTKVKVTTTTTTTSGATKVKTQSQSQSKPKSGSEFSILKTFSSQKPSQNFNDPLFQPSDESLYSSKPEVQDYQMLKIPKFLREKKKVLLSQFALAQKEGRYSWAKLGEIMDTNKLSVLKSNQKLSQDVVQGELGDCYFLSVLAAFGEEPNIINKIIDPKEKGNSGSYTANVIIHGEPVKIVVDDIFPVANDSKLAFAGINENSGNIWPMVLEKAWAKCNRSYEDIIPGNSADAFEFLSPAPFNTYYHNAETRPTLFETITEANQKGYIVLADITETASTNLETLSKLGLITNHAYTVINSAVLKKSNGAEIKLLKMKNMWGTNEWVGDWSDNSSKWTQEFKKEVGLEQKQEGIFWISYEDYLQFYTTTHICKIHPNYEYVTKKFKSSKANNEPLNLSKVVVKQPGHGYFIVNQKNTRIYRNLKDPEYNEKVDYESQVVSDTIKALKGTELDSNLEVLEGNPGQEVNKNTPVVIQFNIAPHSECVIFLQKADEDSDIDLNSDLCFDYLPNILLGEQKFTSKKYRLRYNNKPVEIYECVTEHNTGIFFFYKNRDAELRVQVTAKFTKRNNLYLSIASSDLEEGGMKLRKPNGDEFREEGGETVVITVEPGETGFFGLSAIDAFEKFSYTCQFDYLFSVAKVPAKFQQYTKEAEGGEE